MADNYLEKKFEEAFGAGARKKVVVRKSNPSLDTLLHRNRSVRGYDPGRKVSDGEMKEILSVNTLVASGRNAQVLRFRPVTDPEEVAAVHPEVHMGGALPELNLPFPGTEPPAYIAVCATVPESPTVDIDLGISLQSMLLKAVELGLNGLIIRSFNRERVTEALSLPYPPLALLALGRSVESIYLKPAAEGDPLAYYRKDGVQYVPKLGLDDLVIK